MKKRFWEIDFLRGVAIILMITYHFFWDLNFFTDIDVSWGSQSWMIFRTLIASTFLFLVGISLYLSTYYSQRMFSKLLKRGAYIFSLGLVLTILTKILFPERYISFGILHLIGTSIVLSYIFLRFKFLNLLLGAMLIGGGFLLKGHTFDVSFLFFLGFSPENYYALDYYPIIPWFGVVLWGIFTGKILYQGKARQFPWPCRGENFLTKKFSFLGRNSLFIYFIHQPILFLLFYIIYNT